MGLLLNFFGGVLFFFALFLGVILGHWWAWWGPFCRNSPRGLIRTTSSKGLFQMVS